MKPFRQWNIENQFITIVLFFAFLFIGGGLLWEGLHGRL